MICRLRLLLKHLIIKYANKSLHLDKTPDKDTQMDKGYIEVSLQGPTNRLFSFIVLWWKQNKPVYHTLLCHMFHQLGGGVGGATEKAFCDAHQSCLLHFGH